MADLNKIPIRYFSQSDPYTYIVDNRPLVDLAAQIELVNTDVIGVTNSLNEAAGSKNSLSERLAVSTEANGTIKAAAIPTHGISKVEDDSTYVKMTVDERSKLGSVSSNASNFGLSLNSEEATQDGIVNLEDSSSIKLYETTSGVKFFGVVPTSYAHKHHGPLEPLVKCKKVDGVFIADEEAFPAYYVRAISTYEMNPETSDVYPTYFYTNDGVPNGESEGTPIPFRVGSLKMETNGLLTVVSYSGKDAELGRYRIADDVSYLPKYVSPGDYDIVVASWEQLFDQETESVGTSVFPILTEEPFTSSTTLTVRTNAPTDIIVFALVGVPTAAPIRWANPDGWISNAERLTNANGMVASDGSIVSWSSDPDPYQGSNGWGLIRYNNGLTFDYYLGWFGNTDPDFPLILNYQIEG